MVYRTFTMALQWSIYAVMNEDEMTYVGGGNVSTLEQNLLYQRH